MYWQIWIKNGFHADFLKYYWMCIFNGRWHHVQLIKRMAWARVAHVLSPYYGKNIQPHIFSLALLIFLATKLVFWMVMTILTTWKCNNTWIIIWFAWLKVFLHFHEICPIILNRIDFYQGLKSRKGTCHYLDYSKAMTQKSLIQWNNEHVLVTTVKLSTCT